MQDIVDQQSHTTSTTSCNDRSHADTNGPQVQGKSMIQYGRGRFCRTLIYSFIFAAVFLSAGIPYWFYRHHRPRTAEAIQSNLEYAQSETDPLHSSAWQSKCPQPLQTWKIHRIFIGFLLAFMFPMISVSPLPKCSWAYVFAVIGVVDGSVAFAICCLYEEHFGRLDASSSNKPLSDAWSKSLQHDWSHKQTLPFWVFISLPTMWFFGFLMAICMSILTIVIGEQIDVVESPNPACPSGRTGILRGFVSVTFLSAIASLIYIKSMANCFSTDGNIVGGTPPADDLTQGPTAIYAQVYVLPMGICTQE
ncbi:hypothetical protein P691DRAFT_806332 [Macrolepiota fuliginosa MF-IS2]|uniref:Uncharacterized protein n=1 Tax=Macrolepiota fuliginosa MF-IS2 TaxID=1400762 RepID=A0A9P6BZ55_9AGAR|nr:hypothetical protein P691DRAFT_806332 [Macrolepiota fuliginosa MF-IS2]